MKLETIRQALQEIASGTIPGHKAGMWIEDHARDIDTLLAEVERLRAGTPEQRRVPLSEAAQDARRPPAPALLLGADQERPNIPTKARVARALRAPIPAPPLPAEVEEMRGRILVALLHAAIRASNDEGHKMAAYFDSVRDEAASLLSRWPGGWRPIDQYRIDEEYFRQSGHRWGDWVVVELEHPRPLGDGVWHSYHVARIEADEWLARDPSDPAAMTSLDGHPLRFSPIPEPPND